MDSPIGKWLTHKKLTEGRLALFAGIDRSEVCRTVSGQRRIPLKLRDYLRKNAPEVLRAHEQWLDELIRGGAAA